MDNEAAAAIELSSNYTEGDIGIDGEYCVW
jgi:hypothetical protein